MKKLILLLALAFVMCGCVKSVGKSKFGERMPVPIEKGVTRFTITSDYIIVETCIGVNGLKMPFWKCDKIMNNDSTLQELIIKLQSNE